MTFLYDIGRVLLDFDLESSLARLLRPEVTDVAARLARVVARKDEFEAGLIEPEAYVSWALGELGSDSTAEQFCEAWQRIFTPNVPMWDRVRQLAGRHRLLLFSNTNAIHWPWLAAAYPDFGLFDGAVLSFEAGWVKPQRGIYQYAVDVYGLEPAATLYIDDLAENIATGRDFGFQCWQYQLTEHAAFERWLAGFAL